MHRKGLLAALTVAALATSGCSAVSDQLDRGEDSSSGATTVETLPLLATRAWGVVDGLLSVVVQNTTDRTLRYATGYVTARTADDEIVTESLESDPSCCEVLELGPGEEYGFYLDVGERASEISDVEVGYRNFTWAPADDPESPPDDVRARPVRLELGRSGAVVRADLVSRSRHDEVVAQAFLTDADGDFLAVVSGRWTCLVPGRRAIDMQLFHPLPAGAKVAEVVVHPVTDDPTRPGPDCSSAGRSS